MRYSAQGLTIRSENAAKTVKQPSGPLTRWIRSNVSADSALDYGCGRLRYSGLLARTSKRLGLVDSAEQLDRQARVTGRVTTVRTVAQRRWPNCRVYTLEEFWGGVSQCYEFVLCANVLSAIPSRSVRSRSLKAIRSCLADDGTVLVVNQHTNSYFTTAVKSQDASAHLDGWILRSPIGPSYFGILTKDKVIRILRSHAFRIRDSWIDGQSNYVLAAR
jgi:hypothetical protein